MGISREARLFPYWLLFLTFGIAALSRRDGVSQIGASKLALLAAGIFIALMIGLRFEVGGDWFGYTRMFARLEHAPWTRALTISDPGYVVVNWVVKKLGFEIWLVNLTCASIFTWGLIKFAGRQPNPWLAIVVAVPYLIIVVAMGYTRQAVALGFILAGLAEGCNSSILRFSILTLFAATFHKTAVIILPVVALAQTNNKYMKIALLTIIAAILFWLFLSSDVDRLMRNYVTAKYSSDGAAIRLLMNLPPAIFFLIYKNRFTLTDEERSLWRTFSYAAFFLLLLFVVSPSSTLVDRLALYVIPLQLFVLSRAPGIFAGRAPSVITIAVITYSAMVLFTWLNYATNAGTWIPYRMYPI